MKKKLYLAMMCVNVLEAIRFYVSFACSFAFAERKLMEGNAKIIRLIARDEALHLTGTQHIINIMQKGVDDAEMAEVAREAQDECFELFKRAAEQEKVVFTSCPGCFQIPYIYDLTNPAEEEQFVAKCREHLIAQMTFLDLLEKKAITEDNFLDVFEYWDGLFGAYVRNGRNASEFWYNVSVA